MINQWLWRRFGVCPMCVPIWARLRMEDTAGKKTTGSFNDCLEDTYDSSMDLRVSNFQSMIWAGWWGKSWRNGPYLPQPLLQARCTSPKCVSELQSNLVGGFNPSKKYESQLGWLFQIYGKHWKTTSQKWSGLLQANLLLFAIWHGWQSKLCHSYPSTD